METQSISSILNSASSSTKEAATSSSVLGKDEFLKLLISQLQNQNPLEPMNDQEYVAQMAQFSSLEQLQNMNSTLSQNMQYNMLLSQTINNTMATSLIGKEITADSDSVGITSGSGADITFKSSSFALSGTVTITDENGNVVRSLQVSNLQSGDNSIHWNGKDDLGNSVASGDYTYQINLTDTNGQAVTVSNYRTGRVDSVKYVDGQAYLLVDGAYIPLAQVREVNAGQG
jgi:flagellar basal-body rod modification protein FlgD